MYKAIAYVISIMLLVYVPSTANVNTENDKPLSIVTDDYELVIPKKQKGLLILFPCFPCNAENTRLEFNIEDLATSKEFAVLMMNFNRRLWLSGEEKTALETLLNKVVDENDLNVDNTFIGGFSGGGNVSLLLSDYLMETSAKIQPKGVFIVDAPIDLLALYEVAQKNVEKNFSIPSVNEGKWIISQFDAEFGIGDSSLVNYQKKSPYIFKTKSIQNLTNLKGVSIRLYSEPDTTWWKENRQSEYEDMNAFYIEQLSKDLSSLYGANSVEYIKTKNKGYRSNGQRHPHSWSIVDKEDLIDWMLSK